MSCAHTWHSGTVCCVAQTLLSSLPLQSTAGVVVVEVVFVVVAVVVVVVVDVVLHSTSSSSLPSVQSGWPSQNHILCLHSRPVVHIWRPSAAQWNVVVVVVETVVVVVVVVAVVSVAVVVVLVSVVLVSVVLVSVVLVVVVHVPASTCSSPHEAYAFANAAFWGFQAA